MRRESLTFAVLNETDFYVVNGDKIAKFQCNVSPSIDLKRIYLDKIYVKRRIIFNGIYFFKELSISFLFI